MMTPDQVRQLIVATLDCTAIDVRGDGHHFYASIVSPAFAGKRLVERHLMVKSALKPQFDDGTLHALSIESAKTPEELAK